MLGFNLFQIVDALGLSDSTIHIVGTSLGGSLAGIFSAEYPHLVERITMICPASKYKVEL